MKDKNKIRVLHFLGSGSIGGKEKAIFQLLKSFQNDKDFELSVAVGNPSGFYYDQIKQLSICIINLRIKNWHNIRLNPKIIKGLRQFEVHHFHDPSPVDIILSLFAGTEIKRILTRRGGFRDFKKYGTKFKFKYLINRFLIRHFFQGYSANTVNAVNFVKEFYGIKREKIHLLYNGIDFNLLNPKIDRKIVLDALNTNDSEFKIGTACHLIRWKRVDLIIRAFARCNIEGKKLFIFGTGPEMTNLKRIVSFLDLGNRVIFVGEVTRPCNYINILDCFILASGKEESFGNSLVEAMYLGIPSIIMNDSNGLKEHIIENKTGFIAKNREDLVSKIEYIYDNREMAKGIAEFSSNYIYNKYSVENMINRYRKFYFSILQ